MPDTYFTLGRHDSREAPVANHDRVDAGGPPILSVANRHHAAARPGLDLAPDDYLGYFENEHGEQWIFVRKPGAAHATAYGGDLGWDGVDVYERTPEQVRDDLVAAGGRAGSLDRLQGLIDPLAPAVILSDSERTWLNNAWHASGGVGADNHDDQIARLGAELAARFAAPEALGRHPNTATYRAAMQTFAFLVGREAGRRGLSDAQATGLLEHALANLPTSD